MVLVLMLMTTTRPKSLPFVQLPPLFSALEPMMLMMMLLLHLVLMVRVLLL